jgi:hypothetical protein
MSYNRSSWGSWMTALLAAMLCFAVFPVGAGAAGQPTLPIQLVDEEPIGEGVVLQTYNKQISWSNSRVFVVKVDLTNPYVAVRPLYGKGGSFAAKQTVEGMAKEKGAIAAINADFFNLKDTTPFGVVLDQGNLISSMGRMPYWYSLGILSDRSAIIDKLWYKGTVTAPSGASYVVQGVNKDEYMSAGYASHKNQINLYTPAYGPTSLGHLTGYDDYVEIVVENDVVKEVRVKQPAASIPSDGYVLWGNGTGAQFLTQQFKAGDAVVVQSDTLTANPTPTALDSAMGGNVLLVEDGKPLQPDDSQVSGKLSRSGAGISEDGKTLYLAAEEGPPNGRGMELNEWSVVMKEIGSYRAFNLDGGGSTTMVAEHLGDNSVSLLNEPALGSERQVPTAIGIFNTAPTGALKGFAIQGPSQVLKGSEAAYSAKGYDEHYHPYAFSTNDITWSAQDSFTGNKLLAVTPGQQVITAESAGVKATKTIRVIGAADISQLLVEPSVIAAAPGQTKSFAVKVKTKDGSVLPVTTQGASATVSDGLGTVDGFTFTAGSTEGSGSITVDFDGIKKTVPVSVGMIEQPFSTFDYLSGTYHTAVPATLANTGSFAQTKDGDPVYRSKKALKLNYNFTGAAPDEMRIAYGMLGSAPLPLPGQPLGLGLWVYGDNSNHWLRAQVIDANGQVQYVDLAKQIDWKGWKYVKGIVPAEAVYPISLKSIYVVNAPDGTDQRPEKGTLYFDELTLYQPYDANKIVKPADLSAGQSYKLSDEVSMKLDTAAHVEPVSTVMLSMPGTTPTDRGFAISGQTPNQVTLTPLQWSKQKAVGLLFMNQTKNVYEEIKGTQATNGDWVFALRGQGTYIPFYKDVFRPFSDVPAGSWYEQAVTTLYQKGIVKGVSQTTFGPDLNLTRAQFVTLLGNWLGWKDSGNLSLGFKDDIPTYAQGAVKAAVAKGIVKGYPGNLFKPDQPLTRAEMTVMLYKALQDKGTTWKKSPIKKFADDGSIPNWSREAVYTLSSNGIVSGDGGSFKPDDSATRAESSALLYRLVK